MRPQAHMLEGGFAQPVFDAQATFRAVMDGMARPARRTPLVARTVPPLPLHPLAGALACTLVDADTPVWLDPVLGGSEAVQAWLAFHTGARVARVPTHAAFAFIGAPAAMPPLAEFAQGTQEYPDRSATLVLQLESLEGGTPLTFRGPGIRDEVSIAPAGLPSDFAAQWSSNSRRFPRGVDLILCAGEAIACLPRSAHLVRAED
ncbi:phosphonate C-P lyase system protein PhnH [Rhodoligotrophos defluvii]|uniref:phosphonate C-P lyase system protein PhnH n=1 Tax=Rhodoligotrophos defluvii TaxID=2561934 RepID=UPI0010CA0261|nr:phosphonate C-P lyase system protein PhnH [Rhodoligotrophos defluvii]